MRTRRRGLWWKIPLVVLVTVLVVGVGGGGLYLKWAASRPFPSIDGTLSVPGLQDTVTVIRDEMGIPHIYASNTDDLFLAQGFVHAQDRFWQMDFWRHIGAGRLSELFGESQVESDAFIRTLGWARLAEEQYAASDAESRAMLDAYAAGVNAYLADRDPGALGFEFTILGLAVNRGYRPEPWTPPNTLTWGKVMAWDLSANLEAEIERAMLLGTLPAERVDQLWPPYPGDRSPYVIAGRGAATAATASLVLPEGGRAALGEVRRNVEHLAALTGGGAGVGSNSWVISGSLTDTGAPILANDPHLGIEMPSIWYQVGLHCVPVSEACPYEVSGFSFAGVPGVIIGHNADIAWGVTNFGPDVMDLYIERIDPDDPNRYEYEGAWLPMEVREETIGVAGGENVEIQIRSTRHGPVISGRYGPLDDFDRAGIDLAEPYAVSLRWTASDVNPSLVAFISGINAAANWEEFRAAAALLDVPGQNLVYADRAGNIGYQSTGRVPVRSGGDGRLPAPGWSGTHEWVGSIPVAEMPSVLNPESGYIVAANNAVVDDGYPYLLTSDWNHGYRARRIVDILSSNPGIGLDQHRWVQFDSFDLNAERLRERVAAAVGDEATGAAGEALDTLLAWDLQSTAESPGAAIWNATWRHILELTFHDELPEDHWPAGGHRWFTVVEALMERPRDLFWDDVTTPAVESRDEILREAFRLAVIELSDRFGDDVAAWEWGAMHTATFENASLGHTGIGLIDDRFNRGGFHSSGGEDMVNATGWTASAGYHVDWLPSMRMRVDLGDLSRSVALHTTGQSGHPGHPHYEDMVPMWLDGEAYPMLWTREEIEANAEGTLILVPG